MSKSFQCVGYLDECKAIVPLDDLAELYEICVSQDKKNVQVTYIQDDWKYHCKPQNGHVQYVGYCMACADRLRPESIKTDLDEICARTLRSVNGICEDDDL
jgi:hypothetical protein